MENPLEALPVGRAATRHPDFRDCAIEMRDTTRAEEVRRFASTGHAHLV